VQIEERCLTVNAIGKLVVDLEPVVRPWFAHVFSTPGYEMLRFRIVGTNYRARDQNTLDLWVQASKGCINLPNQEYLMSHVLVGDSPEAASDMMYLLSSKVR
jgi:hypothetical protein